MIEQDKVVSVVIDLSVCAYTVYTGHICNYDMVHAFTQKKSKMKKEQKKN